jgi:hypothetical protein
MDKAQVLQIMGEPRIREAFTDHDDVGVEALFYQTEFVGMAVNPTESDLTPILIKDGQVIGWGRTFYETRVRLQLELLP